MCLELGYPHPDYLLEDLTASQLAEWEAFDKIDPIGSFRADYRMAQICSTNTNLAIQVNKGKKNVKLTTAMDFMPDYSGELKEKRNKPQSVEEMKRILLGMVDVQNSKIRKERKKLNSKEEQR